MLCLYVVLVLLTSVRRDDWALASCEIRVKCGTILDNFEKCNHAVRQPRAVRREHNISLDILHLTYVHGIAPSSAGLPRWRTRRRVMCKSIASTVKGSMSLSGYRLPHRDLVVPPKRNSNDRLRDAYASVSAGLNIFYPSFRKV